MRQKAVVKLHKSQCFINSKQLKEKANSKTAVSRKVPSPVKAIIAAIQKKQNEKKKNNKKTKNQQRMVLKIF